MPAHVTPLRWTIACLVLWHLCVSSQAALTPSNVLVVYNAPASDPNSHGKQIADYYAIKRPGVRLVNLDEEALYHDHDGDDGAVTPEVPLATISYDLFKNRIRNPLQAHLTINNLTEQIRVIVLTKGIPHRVQDLNIASGGDNPSTAESLVDSGNATFASVDSELTLLFHDLDSGEANGSLDSPADDLVCNPFYQSSTAFPSTSSPQIDNSATSTFVDLGDIRWELSNLAGTQPRDSSFIYLTSRLDGNSVSDVNASIDRASSVIIDTKRSTILLDASSRTLDTDFFTMVDYDLTSSRLDLDGWTSKVHDRSSQFYIGTTPNTFIGTTPTGLLTTVGNPIAFLASFGANHDSYGQTDWIHSFRDQLPNGAIFNTYESYNGKALGGLGGYSDHAQAAEWIGIGGTFALGHVWEPFAQTAGRNLFITSNFYQSNFTWVEAAWSGIPFLSWQNIVLGDPLATAVVANDIPQLTWSVVGPDYTSTVLEEAASAHTITITSDEIVTTDLNVSLRFSGAKVIDDYQTNIPGFLTGTAASVTIPNGQQSVAFTLDVVDDASEEGLEILELSVSESSDINGDGYGDLYGITDTSSIVIPIAEDPFSWWRFTQFDKNLSISTAGNDPDADGLENLWEYLFNQNPNMANTPPEGGTNSALISLNAVIEDNSITFEIPNASDLPADLKFTLESAPDLTDLTWDSIASRTGNQSWQLATDVTLTTDDTPPNTDIITVTAPDGGRGFCQFKLETVSTP